MSHVHLTACPSAEKQADLPYWWSQYPTVTQGRAIDRQILEQRTFEEEESTRGDLATLLHDSRATAL